MIQNKKQNIQQEPTLSAETTLLFLSDIDILAKNMAFNNSVNLIEQTNFVTFEQEDINEFMHQTKEEHKFWYENPEEFKVNSISNN